MSSQNEVLPNTSAWYQIEVPGGTNALIGQGISFKINENFYFALTHILAQ